jgi:hypothetical protein
MTHPPAGWYPDPTNPEQERRWDGEQWTEERRPLAKTDREGVSLRPDIQAAKDRMNVAWGGRRELRKLTEHLWPGEQVGEITTGYYGGGTGLIILTDRRLLFVKEGWVGKKSTDFPIEKVSSIEFSSGLLLGKVVVHASGNRSEIDNVNKQDGKRIVDNIRARLSQAPPQPTAATPVTAQAGAGTASDPVEQIKKLAELRDAGVVTEEEFAAKKAQLLDQLEIRSRTPETLRRTARAGQWDSEPATSLSKPRGAPGGRPTTGRKSDRRTDPISRSSSLSPSTWEGVRLESFASRRAARPAVSRCWR